MNLALNPMSAVFQEPMPKSPNAMERLKKIYWGSGRVLKVKMSPWQHHNKKAERGQKEVDEASRKSRGQSTSSGLPSGQVIRQNEDTHQPVPGAATPGEPCLWDLEFRLLCVPSLEKPSRKTGSQGSSMVSQDVLPRNKPPQRLIL